MKIWDKFKKGFKKIKKTTLVIIGVVSLAAIKGGAYWVNERKGYEINTAVINEELNDAIFIGDTGESTDERDKVLELIKKDDPAHIFLLGDLGYPNGVKDQEEFDKWIKPFIANKSLSVAFYLKGREVIPYIKGSWELECVLGNHDSYATNTNERNWLALNADKNGCKFGNYYRGQIYSNVCLGLMDTTIYDIEKILKTASKVNPEKKDDLIEVQDKIRRQESYFRTFFDDSRCIGKQAYLAGHHTILTYGPHRNDGNPNFAQYVLSLPINKYISGHDHLLARSFSANIEFIVSGSGANLSKCKSSPAVGFCQSKIGYFIFRNGNFDIRTIGE